MLLAIVIWIFCGIGAAFVAQSRGASGCLWFGLGVLFGPFGLAFAFASGTDRICPHCRERVHPEATRCPKCQADIPATPSGVSEHDPHAPALEPSAHAVNQGVTTSPATKKCPDCAEDVRFEARKCRFCGFNFPEVPAVEPKPVRSEAETVPTPDLLPVGPSPLNPESTVVPVVAPTQAVKRGLGLHYLALPIFLLVCAAILWIVYAASQHGLKSEDLDGEPVSDAKQQSALYDLATRRVRSNHPDLHPENFASQMESIIQKKGGHFRVLLHYRAGSNERRFLCSINETGADTCEEK